MYSKLDILNLINFLKFKDSEKYVYLIDFLEGHILQGHLDLGVSEPGTQGAAIFIEDLKQTYPDVYYALFKMPEKEGPLYLAHENDQEHPIALWKLQFSATDQL